MNRHDRRAANARRHEKIDDIIHENKNVRVVLDLSGDQPAEQLKIKGTLTEDAEFVDLKGEQTVKLVAQCGDLLVVGCIAQPKRDGLAAVLRHFKKGAVVQISGLFTPTTFERHEGTDILKPIGGMMVVTNGSVITEKRETQG